MAGTILFATSLLTRRAALGAEFAAYVTADLAKWTRLAKEANLKIE